MNFVFKPSFVFCLIVSCAFSVTAQRTATRSDGTQVTLFSDGTWEYASAITLPENPTVLDSPSFTGNTLNIEGHEARNVELVRYSRKKRGLNDLNYWIHSNGLTLNGIQDVPRYLKKRGRLPRGTPMTYKGEPLLHFFEDSTYRTLVYGDYLNNGVYLVVTSAAYDSILYSWDLSNYTYAPLTDTAELFFTKQGPRWVQIVENKMYVCFAHRTYARSSGGQNGYLICYDLTTGKIIWETEPLHCNSNNFTLHNGIIYCGYGFTKEDDFLILIDPKTGNLIDRYKVKTQVEHVAVKDNKVYVRSYWSDYIYEIR